MFGRVLSALFAFSGWLLQSAIIKFVFYFAIFYFVTEAIVLLIPLLPGIQSITTSLSAQTPGIWYFLDLLQLNYGLPLCLSAWATRFIIRRMPVIG